MLFLLVTQLQTEENEFCCILRQEPTNLTTTSHKLLY